MNKSRAAGLAPAAAVVGLVAACGDGLTDHPRRLPGSTVRLAAMIGVFTLVSVAAAACTGETARAPDAGSAADNQAEIVDVLRRYLDAYNAGDVRTMNDTACAAAQRGEAAPPLLPTVVHQIGVADIAGDSATVPVSLSIETRGQPSPPASVNIGVVKEDGMWKFCMMERPTTA